MFGRRKKNQIRQEILNMGKRVCLLVVFAAVWAGAFTGCMPGGGNDNMDASVLEPQTAEQEPYEMEDVCHRHGTTENPLELYHSGKVLPDYVQREVSVPPESVLEGDLILYDRFKTDGFVFEWLVSDYYDPVNPFLEDGVLLISREDGSCDVQVVHVEGEGGDGGLVSVQDKFRFKDVNFDGAPDLLICTGGHGNQGALKYYCFLQTGDGFLEAPSFTEILNPAVDEESKVIRSAYRNCAASHSWAEYTYCDGVYTEASVLTEELEHGQADEVWVWTVNGEEIGRSDRLTEGEIEDLLYNENSRWGIMSDRWYRDM